LITSRKSADGADGRPMLARSSTLDKPSGENLQPGWHADRQGYFLNGTMPPMERMIKARRRMPGA
jgi:hypothetical protein